MAVSKVVLAKLSPTMEEGTIVKWNKKEGDVIKQGDVLAEIETDKANMEMESQANGVLRKILVQAGGKAPIGALIGVIAEPNEDIGPMLAKAGAAAKPAAATGRSPGRRSCRPAAACSCSGRSTGPAGGGSGCCRASGARSGRCSGSGRSASGSGGRCSRSGRPGARGRRTGTRTGTRTRTCTGGRARVSTARNGGSAARRVG